MFVITGRCGSTWLGRMLEDMGFIGRPKEWFNTAALPGFYQKRGAKGLADYVQKTASLAPVFGMQIDANRLFHLSDVIATRKTFDGFAMIDLRRRDFVAQAFSFARASKSGEWHNAEGPPPEVSDTDVWHHIRGIIGNEQKLERWYARHKTAPMPLVYEDLVADHHGVIVRILSHIARDGTPPAYSPPPERQKRNGPGGPDLALLAFLGRHARLIEDIHAARATIDIVRATNKL